MTVEQEDRLRKILDDHGKPDPSIIQKLPKRRKNQDGSFTTIELDFVGHSDITKILIEVDPLWEWTPLAVENGRPAIHVENGIATMWGYLTLCGHSRLGVGSAPAHKEDYEKELIGDFLRNASMRFGIGLSLWTRSQSFADDDAPSPAPQRKIVSSGGPDMTQKVMDAFEGTQVVTEQPRAAKAPAKAAPASQGRTGGISEKQVFTIKKVAKEKNVSNLLAYAGSLIGRDVDDLMDLTVKEASTVIGDLLNGPTQPSGGMFEDEEPF